MFLNDTKFPHRIVVDSPPPPGYNTLFAAWPIRFYVFDPIEGERVRLSYQSEPDSDTMCTEDVDRYLSARFPEADQA